MRRFVALFVVFAALFAFGASAAQAGGTETYCPPAGTVMAPTGTAASNGFSTWYNRRTPKVVHTTWVFDEKGCMHNYAYKSVVYAKFVKKGVVTYKWQYATGVRQRWVTVNVINPVRPKSVISLSFYGKRARITSNDLPFFKVKGKYVSATVVSITTDYTDPNHKSYTFGYEAYPEEGGQVGVG